MRVQSSASGSSMPQQQLPPASGGVKRKAPENPPAAAEAVSTDDPDIPDNKDYDEIRAVIITWEDHDHNQSAHEDEIEDVINLFEKRFGVWKCVRITIPTIIPDCTAAKYVRTKYEEFKRHASGENVLNLVYYAGHSGRGGPAGWTAGSRSIGGQEFAWSPLLESTIFSGKEDTVVIIDSCLAGKNAQSKFRGCKDVFGASAGLSSGPGPGSFTSFFVKTAWTADKPFTMLQWARATLWEAREQNFDCTLPTLAYFGDKTYRILFKWKEWAQKRIDRVQREAEEAARLKREDRLSSLRKILDEIRQADGMESDWYNEEELAEIEADPKMTEPFSQRGVYRAFRRVVDADIETKLTGPSDDDSDEEMSDRSEDYASDASQDYASDDSQEDGSEAEGGN